MGRRSSGATRGGARRPNHEPRRTAVRPPFLPRQDLRDMKTSRPGPNRPGTTPHASADVITKVSGGGKAARLDALRLQRPALGDHAQGSCEAVLKPRDPGGLCHAPSDALAGEMQRPQGDEAHAAHYTHKPTS